MNALSKTPIPQLFSPWAWLMVPSLGSPNSMTFCLQLYQDDVKLCHVIAENSVQMCVAESAHQLQYASMALKWMISWRSNQANSLIV